MAIRFTPDDAVYYYDPGPNYNLRPTIIYAVVVNVTATRVSIRYEDGRRRVVKPESLLLAGYCPSCEWSAIERDGLLLCPKCNQPAIDEPPPDRLTLDWYTPGTDMGVRVARECVLTGGSWSEGYERVRVHDQDALIVMLKRFELYEAWRHGEFCPSLRMERLAVLNDVDGFRDLYHQMVAQESQLQAA